MSELVKGYDDGAGKRDRSESGDVAPNGKRRQPVNSPRQSPHEVKVLIEDAIEGLEDRFTVFLSRELHEFKDGFLAKFDALNTRIKDLEDHVNERDIALESMAAQLQETRSQVKQLNERSEKAEMNSRIPCLVLSGSAMAPRRGRLLAAPLPLTGGPAPRGTGSAAPAEPGVSRAGGSGAAGGGAAGGGRAGGRESRESEDVNALVIGAVRERLRGLNITEDDIDRAHRLPGPNHKVIVRFVRSGPGSVREQLMTRRMELRESKDLFINESLTTQKSHIYHSLLEARKTGKVYTVFTRWGHVYYKAERFGTSSRVDNIEKVRKLWSAVKE